MNKFVGIILGGIVGSIFGPVFIIFGAILGGVLTHQAIAPSTYHQKEDDLDNSSPFSENGESSFLQQSSSSCFDETDLFGFTTTIDDSSDTIFDDSLIDSSSNDTEPSFSSFNNNVINPVTGLPMTGGIGGIDIGGSPYGTELSDIYSSDD